MVSPQPASRSDRTRVARDRTAADGRRRSWQERASPLARYALLAYVLVAVDASLYPFAGWRDLGLGAYDYLLVDWPTRPLPFDLLVNGVGYLPLGFVAGLAVHPRLRGVASVVLVTLGCALLSIHLEALQTYLPSRVASKVDVVANVCGGAIGALLGARHAHALLDTGRLRVWRTRWFAKDASRGLVLIVVWFASLVYPDAFVLGLGGLLKTFDADLSIRIASSIGLVDQNDPVATAHRFQLAESVVAGTMLFGAGALFLNLLRPGLAWPRRVVALASFAGATAAVVVLARESLLDAAGAWPPGTPGSRNGVADALLGLLVATLLPARMRWMLASVAFVVSLAIVNIYPDNPYGSAVSTAWTRGKLLNFYGLASGLNLVWPYLAMVYLMRHRGAWAKRADDRDAERPQSKRSPSSL